MCKNDATRAAKAARCLWRCRRSPAFNPSSTGVWPFEKGPVAAQTMLWTESRGDFCSEVHAQRDSNPAPKF